MLLAELDDVPDDQEVSGKAQLRNQRKLVLHLLFARSSRSRLPEP